MRLRPGLALLAASLLPIFQTAFVHAQSARPAAGAPISQHSPSSAESQTQQRLSEQMRIRAAMARMHAHPGTSPHTSSGGAIIETIAGSAPFQSPIQALQAGLTDPSGIATDAAGNIYLSIPEFRVVLKVDTNSNATVYAGQALGPGPFQQSGDGGPATSATLGYPAGLSFDSNNNLYIADSDFDTVRVVSSATGKISTVAGTPGQYGHKGDGGPALNAELEEPISVALDSAGNLYIAEKVYLRKVNLQSGIISTIAGGATESQACNLPVTQSCAGTALELVFQASSALVAGTTKLYASMDTASQGTDYDSEVVTVSYQTGQVQLIAGGGTDPDGPMIGPTAIGSTFLFPAQIALDSTGNLDIAIDTVVLQLPNGGTTLTTLAGTMNDFGYSGDNGPATSALLSVPGGLAFSPLGALLVADWTRVRSISAGDITTVAGDGKFNFYGDGGPATQAGLSQPKDTAFDGAGNLYIADVGNNTVRKVDAVTGAITTVWGTPVYDPNFPLQTEVPLLYDIAADDAIHLFLSTSQGIQLLDVTTGETTLVAGSFAGGGPGQLSFDGQHTLAVESIFDVLTFDTNTQQTIQIIPPFEQVAGLALDGKGNVYFSFDCSVWEENISTKAVTEIAGGQGVDNCSPSAGGNLATNNALYSPGFLHLDGAGHLLIAEADRVDSVDLAAGTITTIGGSEVLGFSGDGGVANAAQINRANSLNVDASGNYYIADSANDRIRKVAAQPLALLTSVLTDTVTSSAVTLTATYTGALAGLPPTGSVTFLDGTTSIGTSTLTASSTAGSYVATLTDSTLAAGTHSITAQYPGDANYAPVTTAAVILTVTAPIPPSYTVAANPSSLSIAQGSAGTTVLTVTPAGGFNQTVSFSCGTGLPTGVSCSFSQASVTPTGTAAVSTTLTIQTTGTSTAMLKPQIPETRWWLPTGATSLACLLMLGVPKFRRRGIWLALLFAILAAGANGCGSGGSSGGGGGGTNPNATPPGTYAIKLATTAGSGSSAESQPLTLSVTVTQ